jgi:hypothetical protein
LSPLTKIFVVLLVVVAMLNAAAEVVFVNNIKPLKQQLDNSTASLEDARSKADSALAAQEKAEAQLQTEITAHQKDRQNDAGTLTALQTQLTAANVDKAQLQQEKGVRDGLMTSQTSLLSVQTAANSKAQQQVIELRTETDNLTHAVGEDSKRIAELTNQVETLHSTLDDTAEKLAVADSSVQKLSGVMKDHGLNPSDALNGPGGLGVGAPAIAASVKDSRVIEGNTFVTLNVGQADGVEKGMTFWVVDEQRGQVLGNVTVDSVTGNESVGRVRGDADKLKLVRAGDDAKTQFRGQ